MAVRVRITPSITSIDTDTDARPEDQERAQEILCEMEAQYRALLATGNDRER